LSIFGDAIKKKEQIFYRKDLKTAFLEEWESTAGCQKSIYTF